MKGQRVSPIRTLDKQRHHPDRQCRDRVPLEGRLAEIEPEQSIHDHNCKRGRMPRRLAYPGCPMLLCRGHMNQSKGKRPGILDRAPSSLLLLLALGMGLISMLVGCLRMLLCPVRMFFALLMVSLAVMFGG